MNSERRKLGITPVAYSEKAFTVADELAINPTNFDILTKEFGDEYKRSRVGRITHYTGVANEVSERDEKKIATIMFNNWKNNSNNIDVMLYDKYKFIAVSFDTSLNSRGVTVGTAQLITH